MLASLICSLIISWTYLKTYQGILYQKSFNISIISDLAYIVASVLFIYGLKMLGSPETARNGNLLSASGMLLAVIITLLNQHILTYEYILLGMLLGAIVGASSAILVKMTSMPEMVAIFNGFGGLASLLVGSGEYLNGTNENSFTLFAIYLTLLIGGVTFTGSLIAYGKLSEIISGRPFIYKGQQVFNGLILIALIVAGLELIWFQGVLTENMFQTIFLLIFLAFIFGILLVLGAACAYSINTIIASRLPSYDPLVSSTCVLIIASLMSFLIWPNIFYIDFNNIPFISGFSILLLGALPTGYAALIYFTIINNAGATFLSNINYLIPVVAFFLGAVVLGEPILWYNILALLLIISGIFISRFKS